MIYVVTTWSNCGKGMTNYENWKAVNDDGLKPDMEARLSFEISPDKRVIGIYFSTYDYY